MPRNTLAYMEESSLLSLPMFPIKVPPLRERQEGILILDSAFISELSKTMGKKIQSISRSILEALERHP